VLAGDTLSAFGSGLTLPFFLVYVTRIRGVDVAVGGLALATVALVGFIASPIGGILIDRLGARRALILGLAVSGAGAFSVIAIAEPWHAFLAAIVIGTGAGIAVPAQDALLATVVATADRSNAFALRNATLNAGYALGALGAALVADLASAQSFVTLYLLDGLTYFAFVPIVAIALRTPDLPAHAPEPDVRSEPVGQRGGYRAVLADRVFLRFWALMAFLVAIGFAQTQSGFPVYATDAGGISASAVGIAFAANTVTVVGAQLFVLRLMAGRRRTTGIVLACACWGAAWAMTLVVGGFGGGTAAVLGFTLAMVVFALGETFLAPSQAALLNDLAPDELRGRYNGLYDLAWKTGLAIGPAVAGATLSMTGGGTVLFGGLVLACAVGAVAAIRLARHLPFAVNLVGATARG
jgi:MFS family permease